MSSFADRLSTCRAGRLPAQLLGRGPLKRSFVRCSSVRFWRLLPSDPQVAGSVPLSSWLKDSPIFWRLGKLPDWPQSVGMAPCIRVCS